MQDGESVVAKRAIGRSRREQRRLAIGEEATARREIFCGMAGR